MIYKGLKPAVNVSLEMIIGSSGQVVYFQKKQAHMGEFMLSAVALRGPKLGSAGIVPC